jgi:carboxymethylenebutenolidase
MDGPEIGLEGFSPRTQCEFKVYPDRPRGFNADYRPSYRAEDAKDAWARMLSWFKDHGVG